MKRYEPRRSWEGLYTPDEDELEEHMAKPFVEIVEIEGGKERTVVNAHDLFTFKPGDAERICACLNACAGLSTELLTDQGPDGVLALHQKNAEHERWLREQAESVLEATRDQRDKLDSEVRYLREMLESAGCDLTMVARWLSQYGKVPDYDFALDRAHAYRRVCIESKARTE